MTECRATKYFIQKEKVEAFRTKSVMKLRLYLEARREKCVRTNFALIIFRNSLCFLSPVARIFFLIFKYFTNVSIVWSKILSSRKCLRALSYGSKLFLGSDFCIAGIFFFLFHFKITLLYKIRPLLYRIIFAMMFTLYMTKESLDVEDYWMRGRIYGDACGKNKVDRRLQQV